MDDPQIVTRDEWLVARKEFLTREKELSQRRDVVNTARRKLPMVEIDKEYVFDGVDGKATLLDLFDGRGQLLIYHFMWLWDQDQGCPSCSFSVDNMGHLSHLHAADTSLAVVTRGPLDKSQPFKERMGWTVPWYSSFGSDFNYDLHVTLDETVAPVEYNYRSQPEHEAAGSGYYLEGEPPHELPGASAFLRHGDRIFHTYSTYARGIDLLLGTLNWLDLTARGRQEDPDWLRHHDRYDVGESG